MTQWTILDSQPAQEDLAGLRRFVGPVLRKNATDAENAAFHLLFLGDSTIMRLSRALPFDKLSPGHDTWNKAKRASRCDVMEYLGLSRRESWVLPSITMEGPCAYGFENPFCTDCSGCNAFQISFPGRNDEEDDVTGSTFEYLPIEFARDTEFQTPLTATSQETVTLYLSSLDYTQDLCVLSAGLHDSSLSNFTASRFAGNVMDYI